MPTIYEYFGIILKFFSKEHLPPHVHAFYSNNYGMRVEFFNKGNKIDKITIKQLKGYKKFPPAQMRDLKKLVNRYQYEIVNDFITFAIKNQRVTKKVIRRKIK
ncbi:MAG: DUF4160 domain-containing protein [Candidatus Kapabacteria bacterium]|jgi:hypothetical protein|nr:DUF4160 domain-containing protein [Candidatus Kapabacteria bacterium]MBV6462017.1 hypothetical protein [Flavobacteriales bacterium]WKZ76200.1 MAG: DUF4160 domain-containing protein [Vicingaceae bacterium]